LDVAIVADDLTGAADAAVEFAEPGRRVYVALNPAVGEQADVLAVDTDSREQAAGEAARRVAATVRVLAATAPGRWFKKMDSTLRGNVAVELAAFKAQTATPLVIVAPAFPAQRRSIVDFALLCDGHSMAGSTGSYHLPTLLAACAGAQLLIPLSIVRAGRAAIGSRLLNAPEETLVIADAIEDADLDAIVAAAEASGRPVAYAGSAGLAAALGRARGVALAPAPPLDGPASALFVVGSLQAVARRQLAVAAQRFGAPVVASVDGSPGSLAAQDEVRIANVLRRCGNVLLATPSVAEADPRAIAANAGWAAARLIREYNVGRLFVTGGDLARALCERLGITRLVVRGQVLNGVPALTALDGVPGLELVTKAGGFGDDDTLLHISRYLTAREWRQ
jgi:uncharacterized protein YgbK (DUF1537 family)